MRIPRMRTWRCMATGLTSLQYRDETGAATHEVQSNVSGAADGCGIEKRGEYVYLLLSAAVMADLQPLGRGDASSASREVLCGHRRLRARQRCCGEGEFHECGSADARSARRGDADDSLQLAGNGRPSLPRTARVVYLAPEHFEAPNWMRDGKSFIFNQDGRFSGCRWRAARRMIDTGFAIQCNNDHGISPDGNRAGHQRSVAGARSQSLCLHCADRRRNAAADHAEFAVVLARLVAGWQDAGVRRPSATATSTSTPFP